MPLRKLAVNLSLMLRRQSIIGERCFASKAVEEIVKSAEEEPMFLEEQNDELERKRNKSRLNPEHRNILLGQKPYEGSIEWYHDTVKYKRRILGRYGMQALGVPAGMAWPTPKEVEDMKEYERVAFPLPLKERWEMIKETHKRREAAIMAKQEYIESKMANMQEVIAEVKAKIAKKVAQVQEAAEKKERRLREVRYQVGLTGHVTTAKIQEAMDKLEKEEKKKKKELKQQRALERQKKLLATNMPTEQSTEVDADEVATEKVELGEGSPEPEKPLK